MRQCALQDTRFWLISGSKGAQKVLFEFLSTQQFDVIVVGAGHAGIEACLASARMGARTLCITLRTDRIGHLPCNCSIGGPAKGHISREVDALGGEMGVCTDYTMTHVRRVGTGKGPAVQTLRAHVCKTLYPQRMQQTFAATPNLTVIEGRADQLLVRGGSILGVLAVLSDGSEVRLLAPAVVLTTGTFLNGLCHEGKQQTVAARQGDEAVQGLSRSLVELGVRLRRFKTGTTPRIKKSSIDFSQTLEMESEPECGPFSFLHDRSFPERALLPCWQTRTTAATHDVLRENLDESPMFSGQIQGVGPRYCPSVEDKIVRFADKDSHPIFFEQEEWHTESIYVQGFSTSMPAEVQLAALKTIPGLERVEMIRPGYAVEYDMADPMQLTLALMSKQCDGLFLAGQLNGTSGYEEAAGQGLVAGMNAARFARNEPPITMPRTESFIGVMIDDLVTKGVEDPYRMLTARAEHRLILRHDNADQRLTPLAKSVGLCQENRWRRFEAKREAIERGILHLQAQTVGPAESENVIALGTTAIKNRVSLFDLLKRPEIGFSQLSSLADVGDFTDGLSERQVSEVREQIKLTATYEGYLGAQEKLASEAKRLDGLEIPAGTSYEEMRGLSYECIEKLTWHQPQTVGQASRIPGVRPADIALLIGLLGARTKVAK